MSQLIGPEEITTNGSASDIAPPTDDPALWYDEAYYRSSLGPPYERNDYWLTFFSGIAENIIRTLNPHTVLDAGCAMGILVEAFWDRGVEACGIDISPYAISRVRPDIRSYCRQASLIEHIRGQYDLVTCIEVMEHVQEDAARSALANLTSVTDQILFSSTPADFSERTHINVRPPMYWLKLFSDFGFWPDLEYDASYITQHAMLLRRRPEGLPTDALMLFVRDLRFRAAFVQQSTELDRLRCELSDRQSLSLRVEKLSDECKRLQETCARDTDRSISAKQEQLARLTEQRKDFEARLGAAQAAEQKLQNERNELDIKCQQLTRAHHAVQQELTDIINSPAWKIVWQYRQWLARQRASRSGFVRTYEPLARWCLHRLVPDRNQSPAANIGLLSGQTLDVANSNEPVGVADISYKEWIREYEPGRQELRRQSESSRALNYRPLMSVVVPVYCVKPRFLEECINSVLAQTYENWELCIADGCPSSDDNRVFLSLVASRDPRIKLLLLDENRGISGNSNAALSLASGDFVVLLDHDDVLAPFALYDVVNRLSHEDDLDLIYSDHDYIDEASDRLAPLFKPDWSPELLLSANYLTHLTVIRRPLFEQCGGFDPAVDSAQDWDLFFKIVRKTQRIAHIPKVLYHWRTHESSTSLKEVFQPATVRAQLRAIQRHLDALGWPAQAEMISNNIHISWSDLPKRKISIIIPSKEKVELLSRCIQSVIGTAVDQEFEILIIDNDSREPSTIDYYKKITDDSRIRVLRYTADFNYSVMNNLGAAHSSGEYLLFLNNDTEALASDWLQELMGWLQLIEVGAVGAKLLRPDGAIQHAGVVVGLDGFAGHPFAGLKENATGFFGGTEWYRNYLAVTGACMAIRRDVFDQIGGFDEEFISCGSDVEICIRLRAAGYRVIYNPFARMLHHECATRLGAVPKRDFFTSFRHYREFLDRGDPYWNPNLSSWKSSVALRNRLEEAPLDFARRTIDALETKAVSTHVPANGLSDEELFVKWFDFSENDIQYSKRICEQSSGYQSLRRLLWFIPDFKNPYYGGICTILRFADYLRRNKGVSSRYVVWGSANPTRILHLIHSVDPGCSSSEVTKLGAHDLMDIPESDACIATLWTTAYAALKYLRTKRKFYFIQDYEPLFYRAGAASALAESTYRFGFYGIANTVSLKQSYEIESEQKVTHFLPCVDNDVFFPAGPQLERLKISRSYRQLFCYARPNHSRNAFELAAEALRMVKQRLGDQVRIVCAGDEWSPKQYGLLGIVENLGILSYTQTAQLYRESDCGVALMFTRHPSYIPFELMASGALVIANRNRWTEWLFKDGENCLLSESSATCFADTIIRGLEMQDIRTRLTANALAMIRNEYSDWGAQISKVYDFMCDPENHGS